MRQGVWLSGVALAAMVGCGDGGGSGPSGDDEGARLALQFERLADSVDGAGFSPTADALRHAAEIVRLTGHATPVTLTIDDASRDFLAVAEQLDFPQLRCSWPADSGIVVVDPGGEGASPPSECVEVGLHSMRTLIAWEPEHMAEVVRLVADPGSGEVNEDVPDVMTGLPTDTMPGEAPPAPPEPVPGDSAGGGGGSPNYPGFMGEYLVGEEGTWFAVQGSQSNALESSGGDCTSDRATFHWAEFDCESARFTYELLMRVEPLLITPDADPAPDGSHTIAMTRSAVDGVRLTVVAWVPPPIPEPGPPPPDSVLTEPPPAAP